MQPDPCLTTDGHTTAVSVIYAESWEERFLQELSHQGNNPSHTTDYNKLGSVPSQAILARIQLDVLSSEENRRFRLES